MLLASWAVGTQLEDLFLAPQSDFGREKTQGSITRMVPRSQKGVIALSNSGMALVCTANAYVALWASTASVDSRIDAHSPHMAAHLTMPDSWLFA